MKLLLERWRKYLNEQDEHALLNEATDLVKNGENIIMFSDYAKKHIESGHKKPGLGSIFADFDLSLVSKTLGTIPLEGNGGVYSVEVPGVGYDLVLPMDEALQLPDAQKTVVTKEERQGPVEVIGIKTSKPLSGFLQNKLSVVVRQTKNMQYVPDDVKEQVADAVAQGRVYSVLSAWPGRGDVPPSSKWGEDWAVIIPS